MKDSSEQPGPHASQSEELEGQLLRRLTEPAGVIDVRYALQKYERFATWLQKRLALVNRLQIRYADNAADASQPLVMQQFGEPINLYSTTVQSFSTAWQHLSTAEPSVTPAAREQSFTLAELAETFPPSPANQFASEEIATARTAARPVADAPSPPEGEFRVSRRRAPFNPSPVQTPAAPAQLPLAGRPVRSEQAATRPTMQAAAEPGGSETGGARGAKENDEQSGSADSTSGNPRAAAREIVQTAPSETLPGPPPGSSLSLTKLHAASHLSDLQERATPSDNQSNASVDAKPSELNASADSSHDSRQATAREVLQTLKTDAAARSSLPLAKPQAETLPSERREQEGRLGDQTAVSQLTERKRAVATERESVVVAEIADGLFTPATSEIVWRTGSGSSSEADPASRGPAGNPTSVAPQVETPTQWSQPASHKSAPAPEAQSQRGEIGIEQISPQVMHAISEKVMRAISLDLAVELERRGLKKWR
ncbi:MAG TPA: hypothetical protein VF791_14880 [Pyrinomonadaceae bacterium]